jgi:hypothetical protein
MCEICGSHGSDYGEYYLLGCNAVQCGKSLPTFRRYVLPHIFRIETQAARASRGSTFQQYVGELLQNDSMSHRRKSLIMCVSLHLNSEHRTDWRSGSPLDHRPPTDGPRENFGGPWRNLDIICNFYVYYTVSLYYYMILNKQQQISH